LLTDFLWDEDAKEIKYQQKDENCNYYKLKATFRTPINAEKSIDYKFHGFANVKKEVNFVE